MYIVNIRYIYNVPMLKTSDLSSEFMTTKVLGVEKKSLFVIHKANLTFSGNTPPPPVKLGGPSFQNKKNIHKCILICIKKRHTRIACELEK